MRTALLFFGIGSATIFGVGLRYFGFEWQDAARCIVGANIGAFLSMFAVLWLESKPWIKKNLMSSVSRTWVVFLTMSFGIALGIAPGLRPLKQFTILAVPAMLSCGLSIIVFGPLRDQWLRAARQAEIAKRSKGKV